MALLTRGTPRTFAARCGNQGPIDAGTRSHSALDQGCVNGGIVRRTVADFPTRHELDFGGLICVADAIAALRGELDDSNRVRNALNRQTPPGVLRNSTG